MQRGQRLKLADLGGARELELGISAAAPGLGFEVGCVGLDGSDRASDPRYLISAHQHSAPSGEIVLGGARGEDQFVVRVLPDVIPMSIAKVLVVLSMLGDGTMNRLQQGTLRVLAGGTEVDRWTFTGSEFGQERALIVAELYRKDEWRIALPGNGYVGGIPELLQRFGAGGGAPAPAPAAAAPAAPAPVPAQPVPSAAPPPFPPAGGAPQFPPPVGAGGLGGAPQFPPPVGPGGFGGGPQGPAPGQAPPFPGQGPAPHPAPAPAAAPVPAPLPYDPYAKGVAPGPGAPAGPDPIASLFAPGTDTSGRFVLHSSKCLRVVLGDDVLALQGAMVSYRGQIDFDHESAGMARWAKKAFTGEGIPLMRCTGNGEIYFAVSAADVHVVQLQGERFSVSGKHVLAFDQTLQWDIKRVEGASAMMGAGLMNMEFTGYGSLALITHGPPIVLPCDGWTFVDMNTLVGWTGGARASLHRTVKLKALVGRGSGEAYQLRFEGQGSVIVQPSET